MCEKATTASLLKIVKKAKSARIGGAIRRFASAFVRPRPDYGATGSAFAKTMARQVPPSPRLRRDRFRPRQGYGATGSAFGVFGAPAAAVAETPKQGFDKDGKRIL